ncbi:SEFIR domain-containing protein [Haliangium ochraceum]|uniref:SEFIR domain protein n=1 Tax=Haliangium ochraceum (strain DSM 14365 / JCM 11303 / SMP-2) TaxID=502025 RepID=D0LND8_HALO1|nr:SEFIR domain-containing protein [Haliangium ochraceum]ACY15315.1 SEFIR domain protein [Haliangium ochraceum DSM 14365]
MADAIESDSEVPKLFISYSWTSEEHQNWVLQLANDLADNGVHVVIDKFDLRPGHDAFKFMEQMVTDPSISKVLIVSDEAYATKSDERMGGVGIEAQIITPDVYKQAQQSKFVVLVRELKPDGQPWVPAYYNSKLYIDCSDLNEYEEKLEELIRWAFDKPLHRRRPLGRPPAYLFETPSVDLGTRSAQQRCVKAIRSGAQSASGALDEYINIFVDNLGRFFSEILDEDDKTDSSPSESFNRALRLFLPYRDEMLQVFSAVASCATVSNNQYLNTAIRLFEKLGCYTRGTMRNPRNRADVDLFSFVVHELFLYLLALFFEKGRLEDIDSILSHRYYVRCDSGSGYTDAYSYSIFYSPVEILYNPRAWVVEGAHAALLRQRSYSGIEFRYVMEMDFVAHLRSEIASETSGGWHPVTLCLKEGVETLEVFQRSVSKSYFERVLLMLGGVSKADIEAYVESAVGGRTARQIPLQIKTPRHIQNLFDLENLGVIR